MRGFIIAAISGAVFLMLGVTPNPVQAHLSCGDTVSGLFVNLDENLGCVDAPGLIVGADPTTIHLNGFTIACTGAGFLGSCQGVASAIGIDTDGFDNVLIRGPGTIDGFDIGVLVDGGANVNVSRLFVTGPDSPGEGSNDRNVASSTQPVGILVQDTVCPFDFGTIVNIGRNEVENHRDGIKLDNADCVNVGRNSTHNNNDDPVACHGIVLISSDNNNVNNNDVFENGENRSGDSGLQLQGGSTGNTVVRNDVSDNCGDGIRIAGGTAGNVVVNNEMRANSVNALVPQCAAPGGFFDANDNNAPSSNNWNDNNKCITTGGAGVPASVCNAGE